MGRDGQVVRGDLERAVQGPGRERSSLSLSRDEEQRLRRRIYGWASRRLGLSGDDFEDMYQAAWLAVTESSAKAATRSLEHHLRWALERRWYNELRRRERRRWTSLDEVAEAQLTGPVDTQPSEYVERLETARHLLEAVDVLTERQWRLLLLADICGERPAQVQAALGLSERTYRREHAAALASITIRLGELLEGVWCQDHANLITAFATGRATGKDRQAAARHLRNCVACQRAVIEHKRDVSPGSPGGAIEMAAFGSSGD